MESTDCHVPASLDKVIRELIDHQARSAREIAAAKTRLYGVMRRNPSLVGKPLIVFQEGKLAGREEELGALSAALAMVLAARGEHVTVEMILDRQRRQG